MDFTTELNGYTLEYFEDRHCYLVDGMIIPSVTKILNVKFKNKYDNVPKAILEKAAKRGNEIHEAIENYCKQGIETDLEELDNFKFLMDYYDFKVIDNEVPIIIEKDKRPVAVGRLDLVLGYDLKLCLADIKTTSTLDREYLKYQLNLYKIGYEQCYGKKIDELKAIHLKNDKRKFLDVPVDENCAWDIIKKYDEVKNEI